MDPRIWTAAILDAEEWIWSYASFHQKPLEFEEEMIYEWLLDKLKQLLHFVLKVRAFQGTA